MQRRPERVGDAVGERHIMRDADRDCTCGTGCGQADRGIFDRDAVRRVHPQQLGSAQVRVGERLAS